MNNNPLSRVCSGLLILSALTTAYEVSHGSVRVTSSIATVGSLVLFVLYRRKSVHAASFLFWTTLPIYPIYFGLESLGLTGQRPTNLTLGVAAAIWVGWLIFALGLLRKYAAYIQATTRPIGSGGRA